MERHHYNRAYYQSHVNRVIKQDRFSRIRLKRIFDLLMAKPGERILDLGCGSGTLFLSLLDRGCKPLGLDFSHDALGVCKDQLLTIGHKSTNGLLTGDAKILPFKDAGLDGIVAGDFTEHLALDDVIHICHECERVLKPAGRMVIYTPNPQHVFEILKKRNILLKKDVTHIGLRPMQAYIRIFKDAGFKIDIARFEPTHIPIYGQFERLIMEWPIIGKLMRRRICLRVSKPAFKREFQL